MANVPERRVWKYLVPIDRKWHLVVLPIGSNVLHASMGPGRRTPVVDFIDTLEFVNFWAEVDPFASHSITRRFRIFATGEPGVEEGDWVSTIVDKTSANGQHPEGLVWHLYMK